MRTELLKEEEAEQGEVVGREKATLLQMFRTPNLRKNAILVNIIW